MWSKFSLIFRDDGDLWLFLRRPLKALSAPVSVSVSASALVLASVSVLKMKPY